MERYVICFIIILTLVLTVKVQIKRGKDGNIWNTVTSINDVRTNDDDPGSDLDRDVPQLIESRGFKCETHHVITEDGYNLTLHRIVNPLLQSMKEPLKVVILQHPLLGSGADFLMNSEGGGIKGNNNSKDEEIVGNNLGFELAKRGYDVWLPNLRGNFYSNSHIRLKPSERQYWNFSFDEMIKYDLPYFINYIKRETNSSTVGYVGHSQGTLVMFGLLATRPEFNDIIKPFIAMAPIAYLGHVRSPIKYLAKRPLLIEFFKRKGGSFFMGESLLTKISRAYCPLPVITPLCESVMFIFAGPDSKQLNSTRIPIYVSHTPSGTSALNIVHLIQLIISKKVTFYDYGWKHNKEKYGSNDPPEYQLEKITNKNIAIFSSKNDWLATQEDVNTLRGKLKVKLIEDYVIPDKNWNHLDFIWGIETGQQVNKKVIKLLKDHI